MLLEIFGEHLRRGIIANKRGGFYVAYFLDWDDKMGRAIPLRGNLNYRFFQLACVISMVFLLPILLLRCYQLYVTVPPVESKMTINYTFFATFLMIMFIQYAQVVMCESGPKAFVNCYEAILKLERDIKRNLNTYI